MRVTISGKAIENREPLRRQPRRHWWHRMLSGWQPPVPQPQQSRYHQCYHGISRSNILTVEMASMAWLLCETIISPITYVERLPEWHQTLRLLYLYTYDVSLVAAMESVWLYEQTCVSFDIQ